MSQRCRAQCLLFHGVNYNCQIYLIELCHCLSAIPFLLIPVCFTSSAIHHHYHDFDHHAILQAILSSSNGYEKCAGASEQHSHSRLSTVNQQSHEQCSQDSPAHDDKTAPRLWLCIRRCQTSRQAGHQPSNLFTPITETGCSCDSINIPTNYTPIHTPPTRRIR